MSEQSDLRVRTHVARDLLAAAGAFKTEATVVWEYVVNSLQYVERDVAPVVDVRIRARSKEITISDNGRGMDASGLQHYFTMHAENLERRVGRPGRGKFGTGKSAAFGIASTLRIDTVRDGIRSAVELTRAAIDASSGEDIPLRWLTRDEPTDAPNGTVVGIADIVLPRTDVGSIIEYVERHLAFFRSSAPQVAINNHVCEYSEPRTTEAHDFRPSPEQQRVLGETTLTIKVALAPLPEADQGVFVTAGTGNLVAIERGGIERKEFGAYLFGEIDVPALESHATQIQPYDVSRSLQLNPRHPVVAVLVPFIGASLDQVRLRLVEREREARRTEEARRLSEESQRIADVLNQDFRALQARLREIRAATSRAGNLDAVLGDDLPASEEDTSWVAGTQEPGFVPTTTGSGEGMEPEGGEPPNVPVRASRDDSGTDSVDPTGGEGGRRHRPRGGFTVDYRHLGEEEDRSKYDPNALAILINLDHPVVSAALGIGGVNDIGLRRLSYEIAFAEYAVALGYEMARIDPDIPADDLLYEVRRTVNRISRSSAPLYS